ncbi:MAG: hypothetical protein AAB863_01615 [Patescibacteria group bacterium]
MFQWWFSIVTPEELIEMMIASLNVRYGDNDANKITLFDRGTKMFKSVCAAMWAIRKGVTLCDAIQNVDEFFRRGLIYDPDCEFDILLIPDKKYFDSIKQYTDLAAEHDTEKFTDEEKQYYTYYQSVLRKAIDEYFSGMPHGQLLIVDSPICVVQNRIRMVLNTRFGIELPMIGRTSSALIGVSGLSESGKSSYAECLRVRHGFYRLKVGYFTDIVKNSGRVVTPESISVEILHFLERHYYVKYFSLESIHGVQVPAFLKMLLGGKFLIVFIDTPEDIRIRRCSTELGISIDDAVKIVRRKDTQKLSSGIDKVRKISDIVIDNSEEGAIHNIPAPLSL